MVLAGNNLFGNNNFFKSSAEDSQTMVWNGQRWIAGDFGLVSKKLSYGTNANDASIGTVAWLNLAGPGSAFVYPLAAAGATTDYSVKLIIGGSIVGDNLARGISIPVASWQDFTYGNSQELWGNFIDPTIVNNANFGVAFSGYGPGAGSAISNYVTFTNFNFNIPANAVITGVSLDIKLYGLPTPTIGIAYEDPVYLTVHYIGVD